MWKTAKLCFLLILQKAWATEKKIDGKDHQKGCQQQNFRGAGGQHSQKKPEPQWHLSELGIRGSCYEGNWTWQWLI
ncbi:hypothetical protein AV530_002424 [Patagioenas fasciata monilis]|uniref:Secreted protein n=1 Tax=Patagioenas fasciata monilis TaxID=372326 RepID=A0A1V4K6B5_PATFA|nr:hypothetical protein AV530_002424 [Patagioenas fasciata monilis]